MIDNKTHYITQINMLNDALLKALFRSQEARNMIASFLSSITKISKEKLMTAEYVGGENPKRRLYEKGKTSDIIVIIDNRNRIIVEVNQYQTDHIFEKNSTYAYSNLLEATRISQVDYPKIILVNIDNMNYYETDRPMLNFKSMDEESHIENDLYTSIHLILANIVNSKYNIDKEIEKFGRLLKMKTLEEMKEEFKEDEAYMSGIKKIEELVMDPEFIGLYDIEERRQRDMLDSKLTGLREGRLDGIRENKMKVAKEMLKDKLSYEAIAKYTKLTEQEIRELSINN